ncbi:MAG: hypothetical protein LBH18_03115 [Spirochaetaceae bacterium]|jgi:hypothetical protein|nr:hypothetical protein [Spirochaetaceae bacterium]
MPQNPMFWNNPIVNKRHNQPDRLPLAAKQSMTMKAALFVPVKSAIATPFALLKAYIKTYKQVPDVNLFFSIAVVKPLIV